MSKGGSEPFSRGGLLALIGVGFAVLFAILYLLAVGDIGPDDSNNGGAHAGAKGLNGYSALVDLVRADGFDVTVSRQPTNLETGDILVLTPPRRTAPEDLLKIIEEREFTGPTLVILPKWGALPSRFMGDVKDPDKVRDGWVVLGGIGAPRWANEERGLLALGVEKQGEAPESTLAGLRAEENNDKQPGPQRPFKRFETRETIAGIEGALPTNAGLFANPEGAHVPLVIDEDGETIALAMDWGGYGDGEEIRDANWLVFVIEPDLVNNWGLADPARALTAISIIRSMGYGEQGAVVFDLTLNGFGGTINLLTLAFQPPFLAATICLLLAMFIIGWRAFLRFGPSVARGREAAFGKARLVSNGADLIVRAGRLKLLSEPYITLSARRIARSLGLPRAEPSAIDTALAVREPGAPSFTETAQALRDASSAAEIVRAARALNDRTDRT